MKRIIWTSLAGLAVVGAAGYGAYWLLDTCRPLDRLLGISGCTEVVRIADFDPVRAIALSAPDAQGQRALFGHARTADGWRPAMVRLDLEAGQELSRHPVRAQNGFGWIVLADDGERAMFTCSIESACTEDGKEAAIVSLEDASILETFDLNASYPTHVPGNAVPEGDDWGRVFVGDSRIVAADSQEGLLLLDSEGTEIASLIGRASGALTVSDVSISPSGERIAYFDQARTDSPARLMVWDAQTGDVVLERQLDTSYRWGNTPAWTADESRLTLIRREGPDTLIELHRAWD